MYIWVITYEGMDDVQLAEDAYTAVDLMKRFIMSVVSDVNHRGDELEALEAEYKAVQEEKRSFIDGGEYCCASLHKVY